MPAATLAALLLASGAPSAAAPPAAVRAELDAAVTRIYGFYRHDTDHLAAWERARFSARTAALVARWRQLAPTDEVDDLSGADWFCLCQDWEGMRWTIHARQFQSPGKGMVTVRIGFGAGPPRDARLVFLRERGAWKLDDLFASDFPRGLKQTLRETIAADTRR